MGAMAPPPHWTPEDDLLLKNSVEAGASLESLAKGAVQFSRRFTIHEIQHRWYSLLYDPIVADVASAPMRERELSSFHQLRPTKPEKSKRKVESVRKSYYAMRKRICNEPFDMMDVNSLCGPGNSNIGAIGNSENDVTGAHIEGPGFGGSNQLPLSHLFETEDFGGLSFDSFGCSKDMPQMPIWGNSTQDQHTFILPEAGPSSNPELKTSISCDSMSNLRPNTEDCFAELSNTLFDFTNDELLLDISYLDSLSSLLLNSPNQDEFSIAGLGEDVQIIGASGAHSVGPGDMALHRCDQQKVPEGQLTSSISNVRCFGPEYRNGVICCTLNTEDPEIPSNDDVFLPFRFPSPNGSYGAHWESNVPSFQSPSSSVNDLYSDKKSKGRKNNQKDAYTPSYMIGSSKLPDSGLKYPTGNHGVKFELPKSNIHNAVLRNSRTGECPNHIGSSSKYSAIEMDHQSFQKSANANGSSQCDLTNEREIVPKPIDKPVVSDHEELWSENEFDVPYFSDVEAMILDMDLSPYEYNLYTNPEVQRYKHEETKRTIIRLEQAANSCTQRAIAAQGALAVLYGRCTKHFIKKSEVLLGRATNEFEVDIDLGSERNGAKISRRQAIIKMNTNGTFHLRNVGKSSVFVNGREVATGQSLTPLTSGCLIDVRGVELVFEINHARVQQYVLSNNNGGLSLNNKPSIQR